MNRATLKALAQSYDNDESPGVKPLTRDDIREWAEDSAGGGLPAVSARPFAAWLDEEAFYDFNGDGDKTNEQVLKGALFYWVGGR